MRNFLWYFFLTVTLCVIGIAGIFAWQNGIHKPVPRIITEERIDLEISEEAIPAKAVLTSLTDPVIDSNGMLAIPDNTTISDVSVDKIRTRLCSFTIPSYWVDKVVIRVLHLDQKTDQELYDRAIVNSEVVQFFEKNTFQKYQTQEFAYEEGAERMGKIAELYLYGMENDTTPERDNPMFLYVGHTKDHAAFIYEFKKDGLVDEEFAAEYGKMCDADYEGSIISSMEMGEMNYANSYIKTRYADEYNPSEDAGIEEKDYVPLLLRMQKMPVRSDEVPQDVADRAGNTSVYSWSDFSSPFIYGDRGSSYPYGALESGGVPIVSGQAPSVDIDMDNTGMNNAPIVQQDTQVYGMVTEQEDFVAPVEEAPEVGDAYIYDGTGDPAPVAEGDVLDITGG